MNDKSWYVVTKSSDENGKHRYMVFKDFKGITVTDWVDDINDAQEWADYSEANKWRNPICEPIEIEKQNVQQADMFEGLYNHEKYSCWQDDPEGLPF